jgi:hypothetical protein
VAAIDAGLRSVADAESATVLLAVESGSRARRNSPDARAESRYDKVPALVADLVQRRGAVTVISNGTTPVLAANSGRSSPSRSYRRAMPSRRIGRSSLSRSPIAAFSSARLLEPAIAQRAHPRHSTSADTELGYEKANVAFRRALGFP